VLHPPRGARSAVACRALSDALTPAPSGARIALDGGSGTPRRRLGSGGVAGPVFFVPASPSRHWRRDPPSECRVRGASVALTVAPGTKWAPVLPHEGLPSRVSRVTRSGGTSNQLRHLQEHHGVDLTTAPTSRLAARVPGMVSVEPSRAFQGLIAGQGQLPMFFKSQKTFHTTHPMQKAFNERKVDMLVSTLCPESIVDDEAYTSMIFAAEPRLTVASRSTLSRAVTFRFKRLQLRVRTSLKDSDVCHVNSDIWTSKAIVAYGSFVVSFVSSV